MITAMTQFPLGEPLPADVLSRIDALPLQPDPLTLTGRFVRLEPLDIARDAQPLQRVSNGEALSVGGRGIDAYDSDTLIWRYLPYGPFESENELAGYLTELAATDRLLPFTVFDFETDHQVGVLTYSANFPEHLKIEIAHVWYSPLVQRSKANLESTYLLLQRAFELGYRRVEWKCDSLNQRSRRSALRMGFTFEGIQDAHYIVKGRNRDTAWFRMLDREWPDVRRRLESMLYG
jgi:RimJ/RimL family protein N-acetyltransferase